MTGEQFWQHSPLPGLLDPKLEIPGLFKEPVIVGVPPAGVYTPAVREMPIPGIFDMVDRLTIASPGGPPAHFRAEALGYGELLRFVNESSIERTLLTPGGAAVDRYPFMFEPHWLERLFNYLRGFKIVDQGQTEIEIPVGEVHCPDLPGCSVAYTQAFSETMSAQFSLTIPGFSGGTGRESVIAWKDSFELPQMSARMFVRALILVKIRQNKKGDILPSVDVTNVFNDLIVRQIPSPPAEVQNALLSSVSSDKRVFEFPVGATNLESSFEITEGRKHSFALGNTFSVAGIDINMGFNIEVRTEAKYAYIYKFADGYNYTAQPMQPGSFVFYWIVRGI